MSYVSSMTCKYGYPEKVAQDTKTINDILARQGSSFLIDAIAENAGDCVNRFKMNNEDRKRLVNSLINELKESLSERT